MPLCRDRDIAEAYVKFCSNIPQCGPWRHSHNDELDEITSGKKTFVLTGTYLFGVNRGRH